MRVSSDRSRRRTAGDHRSERGSVLLLFPAAVFVLCVLAALAVDAAHATMRRRELQHAADAAANDAAALSIDEVALRDGATVLDEDRARRVVVDSIARQGLGGDVQVLDVRVVDRTTVVVELEARHPSVFARSIPGAADEIRVAGTGHGRGGHGGRRTVDARPLIVDTFNAFQYFSFMPTMVKTATTPAARDRLRHEAALLARARHPGVVQLLEFDELDGRTRVVLARPDGTTLAAARRPARRPPCSCWPRWLPPSPTCTRSASPTAGCNPITCSSPTGDRCSAASPRAPGSPPITIARSTTRPCARSSTCW